MKNDRFETDEYAGDDIPITIESDNDDTSTASSATPTYNGDMDKSTSETLQNRERVMSVEDKPNTDEGIESRKLYDEHSKKIFPRICTDGLTGLLIDIVSNFITSFHNLHSALSNSTRYDASSTLSTASTELLSIVNSIASITGSSSVVFSSLTEILPKAFRTIAALVSKLNVQTLATEVTGTINDLQKSLTRAIQIVNDADEKLKLDVVKKFESATILVAKSVQTMVNILNVIAEATTEAIGSVSRGVQEAVVSLSLVLATVLVIVQSVYASIACVLSSLQITSATINKVLSMVDSALESMIGVITSTTNSIPGSMSVDIGDMLNALANNLNASMERIQSTVDFDASNSFEDLLNRISESVGNITSSITNSVTLVTSSLNVVSAMPIGILPKVASQISLVYKGLSKVTGTENLFIVIILINSLVSIFDSIKSASNILVSGIGAEASETIKKFAGNVQISLESLLSLVSGSTKGYVNIQEIVQEIGKNVQYVAAIVASITSTISDTISNVNVVVVDAVLSLPFILSAILYVVQWVLSVAVSIFATIAGSVSDILSELTILISVTFENVSRICSIIARSASDSLTDTVDSISSNIEELSGLVSFSFSRISGVAVNIVFNIDQILSGVAKQDDKSLADLIQGTEGTVLQIINGLTGKLSSISPVLSSALYSLNNSLKIASTSDSASIKVISQVLILVLSQITTVTGSASEILSLTSNVLGLSFGHISTLVSKFAVLGDVSVSLTVSVSNIHSALSLLTDTIDDCSRDLSVLDDPIKNVAKTTQILISTFSAIVDATSRTNEDAVLSEVILNLPYVVSTIIFLVQNLLGAAIAKVLITFGSIPTNLKQLALAMSTILQRITSITAEITLSLIGSDANYVRVINNILSSVSELNSLTSTSLSVISGILANIKVSMDGSDVVE